MKPIDGRHGPRNTNGNNNNNNHQPLKMQKNFMNKESPQIVGLRPPMCSQIFLPANVNANQFNILVHLQLL